MALFAPPCFALPSIRADGARASPLFRPPPGLELEQCVALFRPPPGLSLQEAPAEAMFLPPPLPVLVRELDLSGAEAEAEAEFPPPPPPGLARELDVCGAWRAGVFVGALSSCSTSASSGPPSPTGSHDGEEKEEGRVDEEAAAAERGPRLQISVASALGCPSVGSEGHWDGRCTPCEFMHKGACNHGSQCKYCHLCGPEVLKSLRRQKRLQRKATKQADRQ